MADGDAVRDQEAVLADLRRRGAATAGGVFVLTGPGGTGKTHLIRRISAELFHRPLFTATTGLAATAFATLGRSMTIHSALSLGVGDRPLKYYVGRLKFLHGMGATPEGVQLAADADAIFIDEMSMLREAFLRLVDGMLRHVRNNEAPFGGVALFLVGDFLQLPPVEDAESRVMLFETEYWRSVVTRTYLLTRSVRHDGDAEFREMLMRIRVGAPTAADVARLNSRVGAAAEGALGHEAPRLYTHNFDVRAYNSQNLHRIPNCKRKKFDGFAAVRAGAETRLEGALDAVRRASETGGAELYAELDPECPPRKAGVRREKRLEAAARFFKAHAANARLELGVGAPVMFNINAPHEGYYNGTLGWVEAFAEDAVLVRLAEGEAPLRVTAKEFRDESFGYSFSFTQIPLELAYAVTVHKAQGRTLPCAVMDLSRTFDVGQGYSALSRVKTLAGVSLEHPVAERCFRASPAARDYYAALEARGC